MPSSYSSSLRLEEQFTGEGVNTWGLKLSNTLQRVDDAIAGFVSIAITTDYALVSSLDNATADQARAAMLKFTGTLASNSTITIPSVSKTYLIWNATTKALTFTTGSGSTISVDPSDQVLIFCDGTNVQTPGYGGLSIKTYIAAAILGATGSLPATTGNAGKFVYTDGTSSFWKQVNTTDLGDYRTAIIGLQVALAVAL